MVAKPTSRAGPLGSLLSLAPPLPREHGAWLGLAAACLCGALVPALGAWTGSLAAAGGLAALFTARASAEALAAGRGGAPERGWLLVLLAVGAGLLALQHERLPPPLAALAAGGAAFGLLAQAAARRARVHRTIVFEGVGFFAVGLAATIVAVAGGAPVAPGLALGAVVGLYLAASVPYVRLRVRPREQRLALAAAALLLPVAGAAAAAGFALTGLLPPGAALAFLPALGRAAWASRPAAPATLPRTVGLQETGFAALFVAALVLAGQLDAA